MESSTSTHVVIAGGGVAGLEALLALRALAGDRVSLTLVSAHEWFVDRPLTVAEPFGYGPPARHSLSDIADEFAAEFVHTAVSAVDAPEHRVRCADGRQLGYDTLILALGARTSAAFSDAITFGMPGSDQAIKEMLGQLRNGQARSVAFVAPTMTGWLLPLYELAFMTARELKSAGVTGAQLHLLSPEDRPLALFGGEGSRHIGQLMSAAGIEFVRASFARAPGGGLIFGALGESSPDYVVTLPLLHGPGVAGLPTSGAGEFTPVDEYGRVPGLGDVYAAGDMVDFSVKQGGLASQQADVVATAVAARCGAPVKPSPFHPVLRGMVFTGDEPHYMRTNIPGTDPHVSDAWYPLWWPPTKVAGRYLAPYLFARVDEESVAGSPIGFVDVDIPLTEITLSG